MVIKIKNVENRSIELIIHKFLKDLEPKTNCLKFVIKIGNCRASDAQQTDVNIREGSEWTPIHVCNREKSSVLIYKFYMWSCEGSIRNSSPNISLLLHPSPARILYGKDNVATSAHSSQTPIICVWMPIYIIVQ